MAFATLSRRRRQSKNSKTNSFDISDLVTNGGKISSSSSGSESKSTPKSPLRKLTRLFRRQTSEPAVSGSNKGVDSSQIFGRGLSDICHPDLPRPITDLLLFLQEVGPYTREIFRKPPNARCCRQLGEKINKADFYWDVDESCNGLLLAAVLKTFLREIPHKLCDDRLYDRWSAIANNSSISKQKKVTSIKLLISVLPESNQLLLRYLVCLLHRIQLHSSDNLMTSYNLSVCIGPCVLWTKSTKSTELEKAGQTIPKLLEFIIMNCIDIFGVEILDMLKGDNTLTKKSSVSLDSVFTDRPSRCVADSCHSIDILTLNTERCHTHRQQLSPSRLSRDSGMILDDHSHDGDLTSRPSQQHRRQINTSYDSLDCDADICSDEELAHNNNTLHYTKPMSDEEHRSLTSSNAIKTVTINGGDNSEITSDYEVLSPPSQHIRSMSDIAPAVNESINKMAKPKNDKPKYSLNSSHQRNTVHGTQRKQRATILPPVLERRPSIMYDKIVYRYITDSQTKLNNQQLKNSYMSLPRGTSLSRPSNSAPFSGRNGPRVNQPIIEYDTPPYGQSIWGNRTEVPMIVLDECDSSTNSRIASSVDSPRADMSVRRANSSVVRFPGSIFPYNDNKNYNDNIPIYENSELYGPSKPPTPLTQSPALPTQSQAPLYENLPFHRRINIRQRPRRSTVNTGGTYGAYRDAKRKDSLLTQQSLASKLTQGQGSVAHDRSHSTPAASTDQTYNQSFHETCYFV